MLLEGIETRMSRVQCPSQFSTYHRLKFVPKSKISAYHSLNFAPKSKVHVPLNCHYTSQVEITRNLKLWLPYPPHDLKPTITEATSTTNPIYSAWGPDCFLAKLITVKISFESHLFHAGCKVLAIHMQGWAHQWFSTLHSTSRVQGAGHQLESASIFVWGRFQGSLSFIPYGSHFFYGNTRQQNLQFWIGKSIFSCPKFVNWLGICGLLYWITCLSEPR